MPALLGATPFKFPTRFSDGSRFGFEVQCSTKRIFATFSHRATLRVQNGLNHRQRKTLGYKRQAFYFESKAV